MMVACSQRPVRSSCAGKASPLALGGVALLLVAGGYALVKSFGDPEPLELHTPASAPASQPATRGARAPRVITEKPGRPPIETDPARTAGMLRLPDGRAVPPLNGVKNPPALQWNPPVRRPFSEIIGTKVVDYAGLGLIEWYVHADGSQSTTVMAPRTEGGKTWVEPMTLVGYATEGAGVPELVTLDGQGSRPGAAGGITPGR